MVNSHNIATITATIAVLQLSIDTNQCFGQWAVVVCAKEECHANGTQVAIATTVVSGVNLGKSKREPKQRRRRRRRRRRRGRRNGRREKTN
jgi:hypothetical protein